jgi:hypothetical protein
MNYSLRFRNSIFFKLVTAVTNTRSESIQDSKKQNNLFYILFRSIIYSVILDFVRIHATLDFSETLKFKFKSNTKYFV